jgi:hypothetical protein
MRVLCSVSVLVRLAVLCLVVGLLCGLVLGLRLVPGHG